MSRKYPLTQDPARLWNKSWYPGRISVVSIAKGCPCVLLLMPEMILRCHMRAPAQLGYKKLDRFSDIAFDAHQKSQSLRPIRRT
jgi:hypothetical protein